jgi:O-antigen ligase/polysaccharide polymerase Wzy-like membrane protein
MAAPRIEPRSGESGSSDSQPTAAGLSHGAGTGAPQVAIATLAIVTAVFVWWAWKQGAYFGTVFFPGAIVLYSILILLLVGAPFNGRLNGPVRVALAAILALAGWTLLSITWTSANDAAVQDAERVALYAAAFALGLWICNLAGRRRLVPLAAVAALGTAIGIVTTVTLASGADVGFYFHPDDATLRFPIGYRNAEAAFLLISLWPMIVLAARESLPWQLRALITGAATMILDLAVLAESRGSLPAAAVALLVFLALSPQRLRVATFLGLAALPLLPTLPTLLDVFQHGGAGPGLIPLMRDAAHAIVLSVIGSVVLAAVCVRGVEPRLALSHERAQLISRLAAGLAIAAVLIGGTVFVAKRGGPVKFLEQRVSEFNRDGSPKLRSQGTRFGANVGSNRHDFWRVSLNEGRDHLLLGGGAGSFASTYLLHRRSGESPRDPHSVEMLMFGELGLVGVLMFGTFIAASALAGIRSRQVGPSAGALVAGSFGAGTYWLVHASYDWLWNYPGVTAPVFFLLGAAGAPSLLDRAGGLGRRVRYVGTIVFAAALLIGVPLFLSQRYENRAYGEYPGDPAASLSDLDRAADFDPYDPRPLLAKGLIESRLGREAAAAVAFRQAIDRQPDGYAGHFFLARVLARTDLAAARAEAREALRLNPLDRQTRQLDRSLRRARRS